MTSADLYGRNMGTSRRQYLAAWSAGRGGGVDGHQARVQGEEMVDRTTNSYAHHRPIPPWTARTGRRDIARGRTYSRLGRGPGGVTDLHAARPTRGAHHCREVPRKDDTTATFSLRLERAIQRAAADYDFFKKGLGVTVHRPRRRRQAEAGNGRPPRRGPGAGPSRRLQKAAFMAGPCSTCG